MRKLYKSNTDIKICGVCGGIGEYLNIDPTLIRLIFIILAFTQVGILAYVIAALVIPRESF
ncbi:MAG TPA: PspC domain-containing protein [Candidatus Choladousia intestinavium]|uniref:PspC domain-containing protein n=1 Tax=Candidatus Choladousia intestinavium TaxID=2840727 RepID=A0A9D1AAH3_9FIRM|nr:PspC domain-containing protein [Candidatus Choladousia intestinavium]